MGVDRAVHVSRSGTCTVRDAIQTAKVLAAALGTLEWDVVVAGSEATDSRMSVVAGHVGRGAGGAAAVPGPQGDRGRGQRLDRAAVRRRLRRRPRPPTGSNQRRGEDQRAAVSIVQGDHGREVKTG